jgi:hypothetical protein
VTRSGSRYSVLANGAPPFDSLEALAEVAGFRAERGAAAPAETPVVLRLEGVTLERAVAAILAGLPHHVHYEHADPAAGGPVFLARVRVGELASAAEAALGRAAPGRAAPGRPGPPPEPREHGSKRGEPGQSGEADLRENQDVRERERAELVARQWNDPRADLRLDAVERMEPEGGEREKLETLLRDDPSPEVRSAAAEVLSEGDAFEVMESLLGALGDADPGVVAAAVLGLEDVYADAPNPRIRERVAELREHRDAGVREAVAGFEDWIEE